MSNDENQEMQFIVPFHYLHHKMKLYNFITVAPRNYLIYIDCILYQMQNLSKIFKDTHRM